MYDVIIAGLLKADADVLYYFAMNQEEMAFKVLQERVYPAMQILREAGVPLPRLYGREA
jgi:hypothetical protein